MLKRTPECCSPCQICPPTTEKATRRRSSRSRNLGILGLMMAAFLFGSSAWAQAPPKALVKRCAKGDAESCYHIGLNQSSRNPFESRRHFALACGSGYRKACKELHNASDELLEGGSEGHREAVGHLETACGQSYGRSCSSLATALWDGTGTAADPDRARVLWEKACELKSRIGCRRSGGIYEQGELVAKDLGRALAFFQRSCELELESACADAGRLLSVGISPSSMSGDPNDTATPATANPGAAIAPLRKACLEPNVDQVRGDACFTLGTLLAEGEHVEKDLELAFEAFRKGCSDNHADSCTAAGHAALSGRGLDKDLNAAVQFFGKACRKKSIEGCRELCRIQCDAGQPHACGRLESEAWPMQQSCAMP